DALEAYREGRRLLDEELGLAPGEELRRLERAILEQDPEIAGPPPTLAERFVETAGRRRRVLVAAGSALLAGAIATMALHRMRSGDEPTLGTDDQLAILDATSGHVRHSVSLAGTPSFVARSGSSVWVAEPGPSALQRIDASTGEANDPVSLPSPPGTIAVAGGAVWVTS